MKDTRAMQVWVPDKKVLSVLDLVELKVNSGKLSITLADEKDNEFVFGYGNYGGGGCVSSFRFIKESARTDLVNIAAKARMSYFGDASRGWSLYKMTDSDYIKWFINQNLFEPSNLQHFIIITEDDVLEVLSDQEPNVVSLEK